MSKAAMFVDNWVRENVNATGYEPEGDASEAKRLAVMCWTAADAAGISRASISVDVGDLVSYMASAIESANDAEVRRLVAKDD